METTVKVNINNTIFTLVVFGIIDYKVDEIVNIDFIGENIVLFDKQTTNKIAIGKLSLI